MHVTTIIFLLSIAMTTMTNTISYRQLSTLTQLPHPFHYNLDVQIIPSLQKDAPVMICCHGYGHNYEIGDVVASENILKDHIVSFNFPDHDIIPESITDASDHTKTTFGSIDELLPLLYLIKRCCVDLQLSSINLYGFSAGGGAIVNALAVLREDRYLDALAKVGISAANKDRIMNAIERGIVILDCPLKSIDEIITLRGRSLDLEIMAARYTANNMRPIDSVQRLAGLHLTIFLHFQEPDDILGNQDDQLFIDRLTAANRGQTIVTIGCDGGHNAPHPALWQSIQQYASLEG